MNTRLFLHTTPRFARVSLVVAGLLAALLALSGCDEGPDEDESRNGDPGGGTLSVDELAASGGEVYQRRCSACHVAGAEDNRVGPHLVRVFGRVAGSVEGFRYSSAMVESGIVWTEETLTAYLADPRGYIPRNRMAFAGMRDPDDIAALMAYLRTATVPQE